jgi:rhodanese-related sulfurtransferase
VAWQAAKIGYDRLAGHLHGGMDAWQASGGPVRALELVTAGRIGDRPVLDVRQDAEYAAGHIPHAVHAELGTLPQRPEAAPARAVVMCGHGERAMTAASILARSDADDLAVLVGGPADWTRATGRPLKEGQ